MKKYVSEQTIKKRKKRKKQKQFLRIATFFFFVSVVVFAGYKLTSGLFLNNEPEAEIIEPTKDSILQTNTSITENPENIIDLSYTSFDPRMVQVAKSDMVDLSYFDDAVFVGDSLADGFRVYKETTGIANSTYITARSISPRSFLNGGYIKVVGDDGAYVDVLGFEAIAAANPGKIYITLGTNALVNMTDDELIESYYLFIEQLRTYLPETQVYVTSIPPVAAFEVEERPVFDPTRIYYINVRIAQMCYEKDLAFINLYEVLKSSSGYLREDIAASDGIHLTPEGYLEWANYLRTHTVYNTANPNL